MTASEKSSGKCLKIVIALLALWSIASLVTIVVWATAPDFKSASQCRAELKDLTVRHEGSMVVCRKNQEALEEMVTKVREEQDALKTEILLLIAKLNGTNATLHECRQETLVLVTNISALQETVETLEQIQTNLTTQLSLKEEHIEALQQNLTQAEHQTQSCFSLRDAAQAQTLAAQSQTKACEASLQYVQKQLQKCKANEAEAARHTTPQKNPSPDSAAGSAPGLCVVPVLTLLLCAALHLLT